VLATAVTESKRPLIPLSVPAMLMSGWVARRRDGMAHTPPLTMRKSMTRKPETLPFSPHDHDVRVERGDRVYWVRGVKRYEPFRGGSGLDAGDGTLFGLVVALVLQAVTWPLAHLFRRTQQTWKVGVLRYRPEPWWNSGIKVIHKERLPSGEQPHGRIQGLVADVNQGRYDAP
jgi:hypothetical protein